MSRTIPLGALALFMALALTGCQAQCPVPAPASEPTPAEQTAVNESPPIDVGGAVNLSDLRAMALYENLAYGVNISYPEEWIAQEPDPNDLGIVVGFLAPGEDPNNPQDYLDLLILTFLPRILALQMPRIGSIQNHMPCILDILIREHIWQAYI